jgi:signal transduction histidine kinase
MTNPETQSQKSAPSGAVPHRFHMPKIILLLGALSLLPALWAWFSPQALSEYLPQMVKVYEIQTHISQSHLWLEEYLTGDTTITEPVIFNALDDAVIDMEILVGIKSDADLGTVQIQPFVGEVLSAARELRGTILEYRRITTIRYQDPVNTGIGTEVDQQFDTVFNQLILHCQSIAEQLNQQLVVRQAAEQQRYLIGVGSWCILLLVATISLWWRERMQQRTESALGELQRTSGDIVANIPSGLIIYEKSSEGRMLMLESNPAAENLTGISADKWRGKDFTEIWPEADTQGITDEFLKVLHTGEPYLKEDIIYEDEHLAGAFRTTVFRIPGDKICVAFEDITGRVKAEQEKERMIDDLEDRQAELERFTYTVSHDLKSPLITIKGFLGMIREDIAAGKTERIQDDMQRISGAADKMQHLLDELLELSRVGRLTNTPESVGMSELAQEAVSLVDGQIRERGVEVVIQPDMPVVTVDRSRMLEVMQNLIDNAVKFFGNEAQPRIDIGMHQKNGTVTYYVKDNGVGIDPQYHNRIFGLFDQLDQSLEGSGIGLALVKRIIETHKGKIWVESEGVGQGTTFCFTIVRAQTASDCMKNSIG